MKKSRIVNHFVVGEFKPHAELLPPKTYAIIRDNVVRAVVDVLVFHPDGNVLLGHRKIYPWNNWFTFGGRIIPGETPQQASARTVKEDLGLIIPEERFAFLEAVSLVFATRNEPPKDNGCHDLDLFHLLVLKKKDFPLKLRELGTKECQMIGWFSPDYICNNPEIFHPATILVVEKALQLLQG